MLYHMYSFTHTLHRDSLLDTDHPHNSDLSPESPHNSDPSDRVYINKPDPRVAQHIMKAWGIEHAPTHSIHTTSTHTASATTTHTTQTPNATLPATTSTTTAQATSTATHTTSTSSEQHEHKEHEVDDDCYVLFVGDSIDDM